ncbi:MAG TPA: dockerin type I domain-containing protein [Planctomycetota bacterium]|nr:dockerin type I domain-containing protein [Planctomycetota bacterium]
MHGLGIPRTLLGLMAAIVIAGSANAAITSFTLELNHHNFTSDRYVGIYVVCDVPYTAYLITESSDPPTLDEICWHGTMSPSYKITDEEGWHTIHVYVTDESNNIYSASASIYYTTVVPVPSEVSIIPGEGSITVSWTTDVPAMGAVNRAALWGDVGSDWFEESQPTTSHSFTIPVTAGGIYRVNTYSNDVKSSLVWPPQNFPAEDVNTDCRINILDLLQVRNHFNQDPSMSPEIARNDVNGDGRINVLDLLLIRNMLTAVTCTP